MMRLFSENILLVGIIFQRYTICEIPEVTNELNLIAK